MNNKLKSNRGATMILALALLLICITISSVILFTASSGATRASEQVKSQQAYLAVSSATDVLAEELNNCNKFVVEGTIVIESDTDLSGVLGDLVKKAADYVYRNGDKYEDTITIDLTVTDARLPEVTCTFVMSTDYGIEMIAKAADSNYSVVIRSKATETIYTDEETAITTTTVTWANATVTKGVGN